jgi:hypothetical protein
MPPLYKRWPTLATGTVALIAVAAVTFVVHWSLNAHKRPKGNLWFYDLKTRQLFAASDLSVPPIDTKSGPGMGVRAYVYASEGGPKSTNQFIAYLEKFTPELKQAVAQQLRRAGRQMVIGMALESQPGGVLVSSPEEERWFPKMSREGQAIIQTGKQKGGSANPILCLP